MLNKYFAPYAEYTLRTKLSGEELCAALERECGHSFTNLKKSFLASWRKLDEVPFFMRKNKSEIVLTPACSGRNSARGNVHLTLEKDPHSTDTILHIIIRPQDMRWFCVLWIVFLLVWTIGVLFTRKWLMLIPVPVMLGGFFLILHLCRFMGEDEIPLIRRSFEALIRKLETEFPDESSARETEKWKKIIDWITYGANMLVAIPVFGLISGVVFGLAYQLLYPHNNPPEWAQWSLPSLLDLVLITLWGRYQYRVLILKTPRPPHETRRNLLILAGCVTIGFLLIFWLACYLKAERMEKAQQKLEQIKALQQEKLK